VDAASPGPRRQFGVGDAGWLGAATVLAAAGVFVVQVLAARVLTAADAANFLSFWSVVFLGYAAASGVQAELTRLVRVDQRSSGTPLLGVWAGAGVPLGVALAAFGVLFGISDSVSGTALLALSGLVCVAPATLGGGLGGGALWRHVAVLTAAEPLLRLVLVMAVIALGLGPVGWQAATVLGGLGWLGMLATSRGARHAAAVKVGSGPRVLVGTVLSSVTASMLAAALLTGLPALVEVTSTPGEFASSAPLLLAVAMTRAPLLIPLAAFQNVVIAAVASSTGLHWRRTVVPLIGAVVAAALVAAAVRVWGPALIATILGPGYRLDGDVLALLFLAAAELACFSMLGSSVLARGRHGLLVGAWLVVVLTFVGLQLLPLTLTRRVVIGLLAAPLAGGVVVAWGSARRQSVASPHVP
jgi:hypothetical protein